MAVAPASVPTDTVDSLVKTMQAFARMVAHGRVVETVLKRSRIDLTRADVHLLHTLLGAGSGIRIGDLADRLAVDAPSATRRVQQLENRQLVRRQSDPLDKRAQLVQITPAGIRLLERGMAAYHRWLEEVLADWSPEERDQLAHLLERFANDVYAEIDGNGH